MSGDIGARLGSTRETSAPHAGFPGAMILPTMSIARLSDFWPGPWSFAVGEKSGAE